jgi:hypothetical protein
MIAPALLTTSYANADQILDRYIDMDSSAFGVETNYDVSFQLPATTTTVGGIRVEFCNEDPLPGEACNVDTVEGTNVPSLDADTGNAITLTDFAFAATPGATTDAGTTCTTPTAFATSHAAASNLTHLDIECDTAEPISGGVDDYVNFTITDINNPTLDDADPDVQQNHTFYVRIYVSEDTTLAAYAAGGAPLEDHQGGLAMATAQQIDVTARVQEELIFRVGADEIADNCATFTQSTVDLGVLSSSAVNYASTLPSTATQVACTEVTTNAANGVSIYYIGAELAKGACGAGTTDSELAVSTDFEDDCINSDEDASDADNNFGSGSADIVGGTEQWGMAVTSNTLENAVGTANDTTNLNGVAKYDGYTVGGAATTDNWTFVPNVAEQICTSTTVVNAEVCQIDMAGTASITTPTGIYTTTLTFIATATF